MPTQAAQSAELVAKLAAVEAERDALLEAATAPDAAASQEEVAPYVVVGVGACYLVDGVPGHSGHGVCGNVVQLVESEARRLLVLGVVRAATSADMRRDTATRAANDVAAAEMLRGPADNPWGGQAVAGKTLEQHAEEQIALAKKAGTLPPDAKIAADKGAGTTATG